MLEENLRQSKIKDFMSVCPSSGEKRLTAPNISTERGEVIEEHSTFEQRKVEGDEVSKTTIEEEEDTTTMYKDSKDTQEDMINTNIPENVSGPAPSGVVGDELEVCFKTGRGHCGLHGIEMKKIVVSSKKWGKLSGNRGYGYKNTKVTKYICRSRGNPIQDSQKSDSDERFRDYQSQQNTLEREIVGKVNTTIRLSISDTRGTESES